MTTINLASARSFQWPRFRPGVAGRAVLLLVAIFLTLGS